MTIEVRTYNVYQPNIRDGASKEEVENYRNITFMLNKENCQEKLAGSEGIYEHVFVATASGENQLERAEEIFAKTNGFRHGNCDIEKLIKDFRSGSVGDVLIDVKTRELLICCSIGFTNLGREAGLHFESLVNTDWS